MSDWDPKQRLASEARELLRNPMLSGALAHLREMYHKAWEGTSPDQSEQREKLYHLLAGLKAFEGELTKTVNAGKISASNEQLAQEGGVNVQSNVLSSRRSVRGSDLRARYSSGARTP